MILTYFRFSSISGDLQYASVVYLHSAADRDDPIWYFEKVQVLSAKLSGNHFISVCLSSGRLTTARKI